MAEGKLAQRGAGGKPEGGERRITFRCRGHAAIRGTHHKTLELTRDSELTARGSCIVGVAADYDPRQVARLRGRLRLELECGDLREELTAVATSFPAVGEALVFRRSGELRGRTFAHGATKGASELDRRLVRALADPAAELRVTLTEVEGGTDPSDGVLWLLPLPDEGFAEVGSAPDRLRSSTVDDALTAADVLVSPDLACFQPWLDDPSPVARVDPVRDGWIQDVLVRLARGERVVAAFPVATPGVSELVWAAAELGVAVAPLAPRSVWPDIVLASGLPTHPVSILGLAPARRAELRELLEAELPRPATVVLELAGRQVVRALEAVAEILAALAQPERRLCLATDVGGRRERFLRGTAAQVRASLAAGEEPSRAVLVIGPALGEEAPQARETESPGTAWIPLIDSLLAAGVPPRTVAEALRGAGWARRRAYDVVATRRDAGRGDER